jgi:1,4-alpha-glucan branching enzyme
MKWNMGWMHDILEFFSKDPIHRKFHHEYLTFALLYAFHENFVLPLSHDEVVHGKRALLAKMPGDLWQQFANLRLLYAYMYAQPGKKLIFMGGEFGQWNEWYCNTSLDWHLAEYRPHWALMRFLSRLNHLHRSEPALHELDFEGHGFEWIDFRDTDNGVITFIRRARDGADYVVCAFNTTPVARYHYRIGVPEHRYYQEIMNTDSELYWGSNLGNAGGVHADARPWHNQPCSIEITMPPLGGVYFKPAWKTM